MVIKTNDSVKREVISEEKGTNAFVAMDCARININSDAYKIEANKEKETALLLVEGECDFFVNGSVYSAKRGSAFSSAGFALHVPKSLEINIITKTHAEIIELCAANKNDFDIKFYTPSDVLIQRFGEGVWDGMAIREVLTFFDYENAPYSNLVLGEVFSMPGRWSSYTPHCHPQPEIYYYRFDRPTGFGAAFINEEASTIKDKDFLLIPGGCTHPQCSAPGYALYFAWMIRHLENDPWKKTRIEDLRHAWLNDKNATFFGGFKK